jgi:hypothetical protein
VRSGVGRWAVPAVLASVLLATGCVAKSVPSGQSAPTPASPSDTQPPVITESALPTDDTESGDPSSTAGAENPSDPVRPSTPASSAPSTEGLAACALPYLRVTARQATARAAHASYLLTFTNTGQIACIVAGYPAVAVLNSSGQQALRANPTPSGYLGGAPVRTVVIDSGQPASALLEGEQIDLSGNRCPQRPGLLITPPGSTVPARVPIATAICGGVQIHPVVAGTHG